MDEKIIGLKFLIERSQNEIKGFGSGLGLHHSFHFNQCIDEMALCSLEVEYSVKLPAMIKAQLITISEIFPQISSGVD